MQEQVRIYEREAIEHEAKFEKMRRREERESERKATELEVLKEQVRGLGEMEEMEEDVTGGIDDEILMYQMKQEQSLRGCMIEEEEEEDVEEEDDEEEKEEEE